MARKLPLRPNVCMLVYNKKGKLFLGERDGQPGRWQFPQGGIEKEFTIRENVLRELEEELGAAQELFRIVKRLKATHQYEYRKVPKYARGVWRGQKQSFWLVEFLGKDKDLDLQYHHDPEFMDFKWCTAKQVRKIAEPFRVPGYEKPLKEFEAFLKLF